MAFATVRPIKVLLLNLKTRWRRQRNSRNRPSGPGTTDSGGIQLFLVVHATINKFRRLGYAAGATLREFLRAQKEGGKEKKKGRKKGENGIMVSQFPESIGVSLELESHGSQGSLRIRSLRSRWRAGLSPPVRRNSSHTWNRSCTAISTSKSISEETGQTETPVETGTANVDRHSHRVAVTP